MTEQTPLERAARALFWSRGGGNWNEASQIEKDGWITSARSAIEEIREPSEAMLNAGNVTGDYEYYGSPEEQWPAMIDAALGE